MSNEREPRRPKPPTVGPTTDKRDGRRSENMADPDVHDGAARPPGGPEPSDGPDGWRNPI